METLLDLDKMRKELAEIKAYYVEMEDFHLKLSGELKEMKNDNAIILEYVRDIEEKLEEIEDTATFFSGKA